MFITKHQKPLLQDTCQITYRTNFYTCIATFTRLVANFTYSLDEADVSQFPGIYEWSLIFRHLSPKPHKKEEFGMRSGPVRGRIEMPTLKAACTTRVGKLASCPQLL
jgi:hypothetical protein